MASFATIRIINMNNIENTEIKSGIYMLRNKINNKIYIGKSLNIKKRWSNHKKSENLKHSTVSYVGRAIYKYGWDNFEKIIIEYVVDESILLDREEYWISYYDATDNNIGYNKLKRGTDLKGFRHSDESKLKMSIKVSEYYRTHKHNRLGITQSDSHRFKISVAYKEKYMNGYISPHLGKNLSNEHKTKVSLAKLNKNGKYVKQIYPNTNTVIKVWDCINSAKRHVTQQINSNSRDSSISRLCNKIERGESVHHLTAYKYKWAFATEEEFESFKIKNPHLYSVG